ncbi:MAG: hemerythrin domain-containing protein [Bacteroidetes bacterium]|nr:MAG: hemerythrin domain-containing protein [Bacteroidota bacterium]
MTQPDPIDILAKEHEAECAYLEQLRAATCEINNSGFSQRGFLELSKAIRRIDVSIRTHNEREEQYLFPVLEHHASPLPQTLLKERKELLKLLNVVSQCVEDITEGRVYATIVQEMVNLSDRLYQALRSQLMQENEKLFPAVRKLLTSNEYKRLRKNMMPFHASMRKEF